MNQQIPFTMASGKLKNYKIFLKSDSASVFSDSIYLTYTFGGKSFTTKIPFVFTAKKEAGTLQLPGKSISFGKISICKQKILTYPITNVHCFDLRVTIIDWQVPSTDLRLISPPVLPLTLKPGNADTLKVLYAPSTIGSAFGRLRIRVEVDGKRLDTLISVSGTASDSAVCSLVEPSISFDTLSTCKALTKSVTLVNDNCDSITVSEILGITQSSFLRIRPPLPIVIHANDSTIISVTYAPKKAGLIRDSIEFLGKTATGSTEVLTLGLSGFAIADTAVLMAETPIITFDSLSLCATADTLLIITNHSLCSDIEIDSLLFSGAPDFSLIGAVLPKTLKPGQSDTLRILLSPISEGKRNGRLSIKTSNDSLIVRPSILLSANVGAGSRSLVASLNICDFGTTTLCEKSG